MTTSTKAPRQPTKGRQTAKKALEIKDVIAEVAPTANIISISGGSKIAENSTVKVSKSGPRGKRPAWQPKAWKPGQSGNPRGAPKLTMDERALRQACRDRAPEALATIERLMKSAEKDSTQLAAAIAWLERGFGKAIQPTENTTVNLTAADLEHLEPEDAYRRMTGT